MSLTTRRRAIYTGLAGHFGEDELLPLLSLWEAKYADKPPFALNEFLAEVAQRSGRKLERARLYRELVGALTGPTSNLLPDPAPRVHAWRQGEGLEAEEVSGPDALARQTFDALSQALFGLLDPEMVPRLRRFAAGNLNGMQVETELRLRLRGWLEQGGSLGLTALTLEHLRVLLNLLYIGLCEYLGPVTADQVLTRAVQKTERMNLQLPPQKLL
ncbi:hypothetical protein [Aquipseudomonas guryensis]|jgi:hypothetical protein|uniref:Uncharacterized protein n=1 Tax=Aquipseudomonas guryensis TaxID=2759165 RepID=A0A7W4DCI3_9GAMM|nr:hypothetical protein [Pseudomonas guryensis]MBB1520084.1 hypothetical protein [Pseudomonas guryensis]